MEPITEQELIELIDDNFNECIQEGETKASAIESTIHDIAYFLIRNKKNQHIAHKRFAELLKGEEHTEYYKEIKRVVDALEK